MMANNVLFFVNGKRQDVENPDPRWTLLHYLRDVLHLTGTKLGCGEGGCGACTVMLSSQDVDSVIRHISANACLTPVCALDGIAVTTVEGIGGMKQGLHPIQKRIASAHGSQCGFCTPGIVMALYAKLRADPMATPHELEESMDGNLCRCTGYRPIIDAVRSLSNNKGGFDPSSPPLRKDAVPSGGGGGCCQGDGGSGGCPCKSELPPGVQISSSEEKVSSADTMEAEMRSRGLSEPIFPPALVGYRGRALRHEREGFTWHQPIALSGLLQLKEDHPDARLVVGNTEVGIETKFKNLKYPVIIAPTHVDELLVTKVEDKGVRIGASVTVNRFRDYITSLVDNTAKNGLDTHMLRGLVAIRHQFVWFASNQIRNVAAIGGNIVTASPIGDLNPMLIALNATATVVSLSGGRRDVSMNDFFIGYRRVDLKPGEVLESVFIPFMEPFEFCVPLKQARRREDDISIVTGCFRVKLSSQLSAGDWRVEECHYALGGMAPTPISAKKVNEAAIGKAWNAALLEDFLYPAVSDELCLVENVPGGQPEYRTALCASFLLRSYLSITMDLQQAVLTFNETANGNKLPAAPIVDSRDKSAAEGFVTKDKPESRSQQNFYVSEGHIQTAQVKDGLHSSVEGAKRAPVGQPVVHKSAELQVTGEAVYTNDLALPSTALHAMLVMSTKAHARILGVDISEAEKCKGYHSYMNHTDVTGHNQIGAVFKDEEVFAVDTVRYVGMVIGVVLADTHEHAVAAAKAVKVEYEELTPIVSIEEAIDAQSFYPAVHEIKSGDLEEAERNADHVVLGVGRVGPQEHFYLETNCTVAVPTEHGHLEVTASTQNCSKTQAEVAAVTGLAMGQVVCKAKRLGGGFGGKEERSIFISVTAALAAHVTGRAVSILIERDVDMSISGQRHSFLFDYKAGCKKDGSLSFLDAKLYSNAGWSLDLSQAVLDRALFHSDNCYKWPAQRVIGRLCKTNQPSHTAFRGFGGPQGMMMTEYVMQHLAASSGIHIDKLRVKNWYQDGMRTHFGQRLEGFHVPRIFESMQESADIAARKESVAAFNAANKWKKRGLCQLPTKFGINFTAKFLNQGGALVHVYTDGTVLISHGGTEMGQGLHTKMVQVAAQCFGISHSLVTCLETATTSVANSSPTAASASTDLYGMAVLNACEQIKERLVELRASTRNQEGSADVDEDAVWRKTVNAAYFSRINLSAQGFYAVPNERCGYDWDLNVNGDENAQRGHPFNYFTQGVATSEVEIDCLTGDSHVLRTDIVMDVGKSINPAIDIGQIEGAFAQGYGWSCMEEMVWGDSQHKWVRPGHLFTKGPGTYKIPAFNDVPHDLRVHLYDTANKFCVHSSKAVGEPPFFLGSSVYWAIMDAVQAARRERGLDTEGDRYFPMQCPATSERIRMSCADSLTERCMLGDKDHTLFQPKGSW